MMRLMLAGGARRLCAHRQEVDDMNVFPVPDGDTGSNMCKTLQSMEEALGGVFDTPQEVAAAGARGALFGARGNSGVILSQVLKGFSEGLDDSAEAGAIPFATALVEAAESAYQAVIKPVEGTILTVIKEASTAAALSVSDPNTPVLDVLDAALMQANQTLSRTPEMLPKLKQAGVVDAGGQGFIYFLEGMMLVLSGEMEVSVEAAEEPAETAESVVLDYQYCTEVVVSSNAVFADELKKILTHDTDSLLVVADDSVVKVHVHTNDPGRVLTAAVAGGELLDVKVDNMARQHREIHAPMMRELEEDVQAESEESAPEPAGEIKKFAAVAVASGEGFANIFRQLGVSQVVEGGQSMNPSAGEIAAAVERTNAAGVVILPNNKNVVMAAQKAAQVSGVETRVIETSNMPQGIAAMMEFEGAGGLEERVSLMAEASGVVSVAEVTMAVRDYDGEKVKVGKGDYILIIDGEIEEAGASADELGEKAVSLFAGSDYEVVSIYAGADYSLERAQELAGHLEPEFPDLEIETYYGGQPHYDLIISAE